MKLRFNKEIYPLIVLMKSAYSFTDRAYIHLDEEEGYFSVDIEPKKGCEELNEKEFVNEMLFQAVRLLISGKTKTVRELTLARAFASTLIENREDNSVSEEEQVDIDAILKDWFE